MATEVPQNEEISGGGKDKGVKEVDSVIRQRIANKGSITVKEKERGKIVL